MEAIRTAKKCESIEFSGLRCRARARWRVAVGARSADAQWACGIHLSPVCLAFIEAEKPRTATLTVTEVPR